MAIERLVLVIPASGAIRLPTLNNFCLLLSATAAINLRVNPGGYTEGFNGITGGVLIRRVKEWDELQILGAAGTSCEIFVGHEYVEVDETDIRLQIATIAGVAATAEQPSSVVAALADNALPAATTETIAANLLRRRITIGCLSSNTVGFRVKNSGGPALSGVEIQPGIFQEFKTTAALDVTNDDGVTATSYYTLEES